MKKIILITAVIIIALMSFYRINQNGFDLVVAIGLVAIIAAIAITVKIGKSNTKDNNYT